MPDFLIVAVVLGAALLASVLILVLVDRMGPPAPGAAEAEPEPPARAHEEYWRRLVTPQYAEVEHRMGRQVPEEVRQVYADLELLAMEGFEVLHPETGEAEWYIEHFLPLDEAALEAAGPLDAGYLPFARGAERELYVVSLDQRREERCPVYLIFHEAGEPLRLADSLAEFVARVPR